MLQYHHPWFATKVLTWATISSKVNLSFYAKRLLHILRGYVRNKILWMILGTNTLWFTKGGSLPHRSCEDFHFFSELLMIVWLPWIILRISDAAWIILHISQISRPVSFRYMCVLLVYLKLSCRNILKISWISLWNIIFFYTQQRPLLANLVTKF